MCAEPAATLAETLGTEMAGVEGVEHPSVLKGNPPWVRDTFAIGALLFHHQYLV